MHHLGHTRSARRPITCLQTPDTFVRAPLPGMQNATAIVHVAPATGARFTQYTAEFESGGRLEPRSATAALHLCSRRANFEAGGATLGAGDSLIWPAGGGTSLQATRPTCALVIEKPYHASHRRAGSGVFRRARIER